MSGCSYCEEGEGAKLIAYARIVKPLVSQLLGNHQRRIEDGANEATSALSAINALILIQDAVEKGGSNG